MTSADAAVGCWTREKAAGADGRFDYVVSVARDITERLRIERHQVELRSCGVPPGIFSGSLHPPNRVIRLEAGEIIVPFTDGISESSRPEDREFGSQGVVESVRLHRHEPAGAILEVLYRAASSFRDSGPELDDMTAIVCKVEG